MRVSQEAIFSVLMTILPHEPIPIGFIPPAVPE